ncbi:unnamed protein product [Parascedosporium putredinis]|uniref:Uncharacterized protein n=1 Tax=Parascedosporium putredinis TaxID=1442378 RepID=A0A9P1H1T9_9PEZI|nr:unnamed protein product [Parascedosporium putredinis]CAI7993391.1 unnamed protein product [Parascedosporium putredinis]
MVNFRRAAVFLVALVPFAAASPFQRRAVAGTPIQDQYIITLKEDLTDETATTHLAWVENVHKRSIGKRSLKGVSAEYNFGFGGFRGYAGEFDDATIEEIRNSPEVEFVEPNQIMTYQAVASQEQAEWGLGTLSSRTPGSRLYNYDSSAGKGGFAYIIDTGLYVEHSEFEGRTELGKNVLEADGKPFVDTDGHGSHVAGTIGGKTFGVAKEATLVSVKIMHNGITDSSNVLTGLEWAAADIVEKGRVGKAAINMSIGGGRMFSINRAVTSAFRQGILVVAASGNTDDLASSSSPGSTYEALTVGAIDEEWNEAVFSNWGPTVDILAPGVGVVSVGITGPNARQTLDGTSMAAPHVTGLAVYLMVAENITDPGALTTRIKELATKNQVKNLKFGSPNLIAYNGIA